MFVCPKCKLIISNNKCPKCEFVVRYNDGIYLLFSNSDISKKYQEIGLFYDNLYNNIEDTWNKIASRGSEFVRLVADLIIKDSTSRYIDIGCGDGNLLAAVNVKEKFGIDISKKALEVATARCNLNLCVGIAEEMPFPDKYFDAVSSIGVMTHFIEDIIATKEINRILKLNGKYILGIYIKPTLYLRCINIIRKFKQYDGNITEVIRLVNKNIKGHFGNSDNKYNNIKQPVEKMYKRRKLMALLRECGFVCIEEISKYNYPGVPLSGYHFRLFILKKYCDIS